MRSENLGSVCDDDVGRTPRQGSPPLSAGGLLLEEQAVSTGGSSRLTTFTLRSPPPGRPASEGSSRRNTLTHIFLMEIKLQLVLFSLYAKLDRHGITTEKTYSRWEQLFVSGNPLGPLRPLSWESTFFE